MEIKCDFLQLELLGILKCYFSYKLVSHFFATIFPVDSFALEKCAQSGLGREVTYQFLHSSTFREAKNVLKNVNVVHGQKTGKVLKYLQNANL